MPEVTIEQWAVKHMVDGHRLCGLHLKTYQRRGELLLATKAGSRK